MSRFKIEYGDWIRYRKLPNHIEIDYHYDKNMYPEKSYYEIMDDVYTGALKIIKQAQDEGKDYVIFTHGHSTSRIGITTSRSQIRKLMRDKSVTPYIVRKQSIQHDSVFVAAIKKIESKK